jgi:hypothetical protein
MRVLATFAIAAFTAVTAVTAACGGERFAKTGSGTAVQSAVVSLLFLVREHARSIELWSDTTRAGPVFSVLGISPSVPDSLPVPVRTGATVHRVTADTMAAIFRRNPDGWEAFFRRYPASSGLVELSPVTFSDDSLATVTVGRSCGEHCAVAWRLVVARGADGTWPIRKIEYLPVR